MKVMQSINNIHNERSKSVEFSLCAYTKKLTLKLNKKPVSKRILKNSKDVCERQLTIVSAVYDEKDL